MESVWRRNRNSFGTWTINNGLFQPACYANHRIAPWISPMCFISWLNKYSRIFFAASLVKAENSRTSRLSRNVGISTEASESQEDPESSYFLP